MSTAQQQAFIDAPVDVVWELVGDVEHHPDWWPRVVEIGGDVFERGSRYRQVTDGLIGKDETTLEIREIDDRELLSIRCLDTGTFISFQLTEAQGGTFVDSRMGMDPQGVRNRIFDAVTGPRYFRSWLQDTVEALAAAANERTERED